jgi:retron-type reverse transcriptase
MGWVLEIDIRSYFDSIVRSALVEMIEKRVTDGSVLRLIGSGSGSESSKTADYS